MKVLKAAEMSSADRRAIEYYGIPSVVLMERASLGLFRAIRDEFPYAKRVLVVAGKGNNGGDALALVRHMHLHGYKVDYLLPLGEDLKGDAKLQFDILLKLGKEPLKEFPSGGYDLIVDGLFGTGFRPPVDEKASRVIVWINSLGVPVVSVDIPSGLSADKHTIYEPSVRADLTVTFAFPKVCHVLHPAAKRCGKVVVVDIGIPEQAAEGVKRWIIGDVEVPKREVDVHKGIMGHVLLVGGSLGKTGALMISARACTRTGSGLVSVGVPKGLSHIFESSLVEEMSIPLPGDERLDEKALNLILSMKDRFSALAVGMGMDRYKEGQRIVCGLLEGWEGPLLLDADGLNNLSDGKCLELLKRRKSPTVLTPHVGEFSRLTGYSKEYILENFIDLALEFSTNYSCYLVLKSSRTAVATPDGKVFISLRGTPAMAKGGVGDALAGVLTSLLGRGMHVEDALKLGVFLHGIAGEIAHEKLHRESIGAMDLVECIPEAYKRIENGTVTDSISLIV
ncbi:NAD(P)H-hydrate dehydratase [Thermocrinis minervae]|uniref:Bifunctional NAD(P)H-hydrate repair enzyme n=1 Tax=Thermocrinis minervae TaxID=381751 RepID=A0A1M6RDP5_9AQUI|nr:NAD(P)H-hydrate dehydratase [Thermocrinis minervae]SHK30563.1 NAD(P)H-hydrate epimerase [Thermocrinis minervae]